ncbi:hypothetical protein D9756_003276 [Leucocoprinus leucothites]|uniref:Protein FRA10AC1 n=1 Tax=Leucocoprinus leucothites TaxID=201217 RepID=A0A8H5G7B0_9AGAR|nr:hypothetical protein D9756_003276 [Leucoagaricus leucothites]
MSIYPTKSYPITKGLSEFEILKASHKFLREGANENENQGRGDENGSGRGTTQSKKSWEDRLAEKYYESLYREFAVCDLKHYKSGNFALRWRTESEVISGAGESTCGNTRCKYHFISPPLSNTFGMKKKEKRKKEPQLTILELPFAYIEHGEAKSALVKVALCSRCVKKLMWKRRKDKEERELREGGIDPATVVTMDGVSEDGESEEEQEDVTEKAERNGKGKEREKESRTSTRVEEDPRRRRSTSAVEVEGRSSSGKNHRRDERDSHGEEHGRPTREPWPRRRSSRSRSPRRRHFDSHSHSQSYSSSREYQRKNV